MPPKRQRLNTTHQISSPIHTSPTPTDPAPAPTALTKQAKNNKDVNNDEQIVQLPPPEQQSRLKPQHQASKSTTTKIIDKSTTTTIPRKRTFGRTELAGNIEHDEKNINKVPSSAPASKGPNKPKPQVSPPVYDPRSGFIFDLMKMHTDFKDMVNNGRNQSSSSTTPHSTTPAPSSIAADPNYNSTLPTTTTTTTTMVTEASTLMSNEATMTDGSTLVVTIPVTETTSATQIRIAPSATIYITGVIQYLTREVVNLCIAVLSFQQANKLKELRAEMQNQTNGDGDGDGDGDDDDRDDSYDEDDDNDDEDDEDGDQDEDGDDDDEDDEEDEDDDDNHIDPNQIDPLVRKEVAKLFLSKFGIKMDSHSDGDEDSDGVDVDGDEKEEVGETNTKSTNPLPIHLIPKSTTITNPKQLKPSESSLPAIDLAMMSDLVLPQMTITPELLRFLFENDQELADVYIIRDEE